MVDHQLLAKEEIVLWSRVEGTDLQHLLIRVSANTVKC